MSNSRGRKVCVGVLGLALAGLAIDRLLLGGELSGPASASASESKSAVPTISNQATPEAPETIAAMIALRLDSKRGELATMPTRDAFAAVFQPAPVQVRETSESEGSSEPAAAEAAREAARSFQTSHRLQAVLVPKDGGEPRAMVDGKLLVIGDEMDNARLVEILDKSVIFEVQGVLVEIALRHGRIGSAR